MNHTHPDFVTPALCQSCTSQGAYVLSLWIPPDVWLGIATHITSLYDLQSFRRVCRAAQVAVSLLQTPRVKQVCNTFHAAKFIIPSELVGLVLMVHAVPPQAESLILFIDNESGLGIDIAWLRGKRLRRASLGLDTIPASTVSNIHFSPDGKHLAFLITLAHEELVQESFDPLHRLRGWESSGQAGSLVRDISYDPCEDCTVQIVDLEADENGLPHRLQIHTFSHVFVPEYGFDMVWRIPQPPVLELAFAAMLHSSAGAATYLVRWRTFQQSDLSNFAFMGCIDGVTTELVDDKHRAMLTYERTRCTSRIELSSDARCIFYDTLSKCGILRFDQVEYADCTRVTRADLPNNVVTETRQSPRSPPVEKAESKSGRKVPRLHSRRALRDLNVGNPLSSRSPVREHQDICRVSCMSPDGTLLCSVISLNLPRRETIMQARHLEMRSGVSGRLLYRQKLPRPVCKTSTFRNRYLLSDKSNEVAHRTLEFSNDSRHLVLWDTHVTSSRVLVGKGLPLILEASSGLIIQDFCHLQSNRAYEHIQMAPDGRVLYATWILDREELCVDAIDVLCGNILKTVIVGKTMEPPEHLLGESTYALQHDLFLSVAKGEVDSWWENTRGSLGCGWRISVQRTSPAQNSKDT